MPMAPPAYMRSGSESSFPSATDSREHDDDLHTTGLRKKRLFALLGCLGFISLLAIFLLVMNIMLIVSLQMNKNGMRFLKFHTIQNAKTGEEEKIVHFIGDDIDLGTVVTNGHVNGYPDQDLHIYGSRVLISGESNGSRLILQDSGCRIENAQHFQIVSSNSKRPIFSAQHPMITIDKKIKKISTSKIITNKVRSPIDENLHIGVENLSIRGNEGVRMEASKTKFDGKTSVTFNTTRDGNVHLNGRLHLGTSSRSLPISPSPALSASIDAFRVCVCSGSKPKIFLTPGNKPCLATLSVCP